MSLKIFLTTWNTGLQGSRAQTQDLTSWLLPVLHKSSEEANGQVPDIYAIGVQELLPVHLALAGLTAPVLLALTDRISSLLASHATSLSPTRTPEKYFLVSRVSHCGTALWVFAREKTLLGRVGKVLSSGLGLWWGGMGNKAAVGVRMPVKREGKAEGWETLTFICTHLEAHDHNIPRRNDQYRNILSSLLFKPSDPLAEAYQPRDTTHLFFLGDLNYRLTRLPSKGGVPLENNETGDVQFLEKERAEMLSLDTLRREQVQGRAFVGMREGDLTRFAPTYKRVVGQVEGFSRKRIPGWTDRIMFASHNDPQNLYLSPLSGSSSSPSSESTSSSITQITNYGSTPELTLSDHKPVHAIISLPPAEHFAPSPHLAPVLPSPPGGTQLEPTPYEVLLAWKTLGWILDRLVGWPWTLAVLLGWGNPAAGMGVGAFLAMVWGVWWTGLFSGHYSA